MRSGCEVDAKWMRSGSGSEVIVKWKCDGSEVARNSHRRFDKIKRVVCL